MRGFALAMVVLLACRYDDPPVVGGFECDTSHGCPTDQLCLGGICQSARDAKSVQCFAVRCEADQKCCITTAGPKCVLANTDCGTQPAALCDGAEDCANDATCCQLDTGTFDFTVKCTLNECITLGCTPGAAGPQDNDDCPPTEPFCCVDPDADPLVPWGECKTGC